MKLNLQLTTLALSFVMAFNAQTGKVPNESTQIIRKCGTVIPSQEWNDAFNKKVEEYKQNVLSGKIAVANYSIAIIFHVVAGNEAIGTYPNISQAQINSQIPVLNADFAGTGYGVANLAATAFSAVGAANSNIHFCLALKNEQGQLLAEPGIDRVNYVTKGWANPTSFGTPSSFQSFIDGTVKPGSIWDVSSYLNIWVTDCNNNVGLLGYATFPANAALVGLPGGGSSTTDGVWLLAQATGSVGNLIPQYNLGRTASHEIGHYLGLRHIGGDANNIPTGDCNASDYCNDTPPQKGGFMGGQYGQNYGSPTYPLYATGTNSCSGAPNGNMFMNIMDYSDDGYVSMFTPNQATRMQTAMATGFYRTQLTTSAGTLCVDPAVAPAPMVSMPAQVCNTAAVISTTNNTSVGNPVPTYSWSSNPSAGVTFSPSSTSTNPTISFPSAGMYTINCVATNTVGSGNSVSSVSVNVCNVGITNNSMIASYISIHPNPSNGKSSIITNFVTPQIIEVSIHTALGQFISSSKHIGVTNNVYELDLSSYSNGVYFITIANGQEKIVKRLILNK